MNDSLRRLALGLDLPSKPGTPALIIDDVVLEPEAEDVHDTVDMQLPAAPSSNEICRKPGAGALPYSAPDPATGYRGVTVASQQQR